MLCCLYYLKISTEIWVILGKLQTHISDIIFHMLLAVYKGQINVYMENSKTNWPRKHNTFTDLDNKTFQHKIANIFLPISFNICFGYSEVLVTFLLSTHILRFGWEVRKILFRNALLVKGLYYTGTLHPVRMVEVRKHRKLCQQILSRQLYLLLTRKQTSIFDNDCRLWYRYMHHMFPSATQNFTIVSTVSCSASKANTNLRFMLHV